MTWINPSLMVLPFLFSSSWWWRQQNKRASEKLPSRNRIIRKAEGIILKFLLWQFIMLTRTFIMMNVRRKTEWGKSVEVCVNCRKTPQRPSEELQADLKQSEGVIHCMLNQAGLRPSRTPPLLKKNYRGFVCERSAGTSSRQVQKAFIWLREISQGCLKVLKAKMTSSFHQI